MLSILEAPEQKLHSSLPFSSRLRTSCFDGIDRGASAFVGANDLDREPDRDEKARW